MPVLFPAPGGPKRLRFDNQLGVPKDGESNSHDNPITLGKPVVGCNSERVVSRRVVGPRRFPRLLKGANYLPGRVSCVSEALDPASIGPLEYSKILSSASPPVASQLTI